MGVINCKGCGILCVETANKLCPACQQKYLDAEVAVAEYLRSHANSTLNEVHEATKVEKQIIIAMIQAGRIIEGQLAYPCERCGEAISCGRYCKSCEEEVLEALKPTKNSKEDSEGSKGMFIRQFLDGQGEDRTSGR